jgi:hypothetical protein
MYIALEVIDIKITPFMKPWRLRLGQIQNLDHEYLSEIFIYLRIMEIT